MMHGAIFEIKKVLFQMLPPNIPIKELFALRKSAKKEKLLKKNHQGHVYVKPVMNNRTRDIMMNQ
jgi:hypothetical protein